MKTILTSGKRKRAVARAVIKKGTGIVKINSRPLNTIEPKYYRLKMQEPLLLGEKYANKVDINVRVQGGGINSQADACRLAIAQGLVEFSKDDKLKKQFLDYDRNLLVADVRRKEAYKPGNSKARHKRQKSYR